MNTDERPRAESRPAPFAVFPHQPLPPDINLTRVTKTQAGGFYGPFNARLLSERAAAFISSNSDANEELVAQVMNEFLTLAREDATATTTSANAVHSCWICIRMNLPTDNWVVPRWHTDGRMFRCSCPEPKMPHSKYGFTILGPSTRVMAPSPAVSAVMHGTSPAGRRWDQNDPDPELAEKLRVEGYPEAKVELGQVIRFSWGQGDSPIHSEPDSTGLHRVFISVLFGSEDETRHMCDLRGEEYDAWYT